MGKIIFNEIQMKQLEKNKNLVKVSERSLTFCSDGLDINGFVVKSMIKVK
ncbi:hypothetical protein [Bacillus sp. UNC437CL72CviS29]|nr:hypothetical protein [Bacillus sp. UNC437CL72CviS29]